MRWSGLLAPTARAIAAISAVCALGGGVGCAHGRSAEERQLSELRDELTRVQADRDKFESRVNALELAAADRNPSADFGGATRHVASTPSSSASSDVPTPKLKVVHLAPDGSEAGGDSASTDDPNDNAPRPTLKAVGTGEVRSRGRRAQGDGPGQATITPTDGSAPATTIDAQNAGSAQSSEEAKRAYDGAIGLVNTQRYDRALEALAAFLVKWPDHPLADNAMFWRGECYFAKGELEKAIEQFEGETARFPMGNKAPDALLKLGLAHQKLGHDEKARFYYDKLAREFPKSEPSRRIPSAFQTKEPR